MGQGRVMVWDRELQGSGYLQRAQGCSMRILLLVPAGSKVRRWDGEQHLGMGMELSGSSPPCACPCAQGGDG